MMQRNPFSTRFTRPGAIPFIFPENDTLDFMLQTMRNPGTQRSIVGPHGSGKSTLLESLSKHWAEIGLNEQRVRLTASRKREPIPIGALDLSSILVIDGFEQLSFWRQRWIRWRCQHKGARLLVTCHAECGIPVLLQTEAKQTLALELARMLLACDTTPYEKSLEELWEEEPGDIRAYFFRLYHWCESHGIYQSSGQTVLPGC